MATVMAGFTMSLDGFVADPSDGVGGLFDWFENGDVEVVWPNESWTSHVSEASAKHLRELFERIGAIVTGRRLFDLTNGWGGNHPLGVPIFVLSHSVPDGWPREDVPVTFVTDGLESAIAQASAVAGDRVVAVAGPNVAQQCLDAGLLDGLGVDLVPILLGRGIRFFDDLKSAPIELEGPTVVEGTRVTHLEYRVRRPE